MPSNLRLTVDLSDGSTVVGSFIYIGTDKPAHTLPYDTACYSNRWTLAILSDTLGRLEINAKHIVRIGKDQPSMVVIKNPADAAIYVNGLLQATKYIPLNYL